MLGHGVVCMIAAWSPQAPLMDRRAVLSGVAAAAVPLLTTPLAASAEVSELGRAGLSKEEFYQKLAERKEAERVAALPINRLIGLRDRFAVTQDLLDKGEWSALRDVIQQTTGPALRAVQKDGNFQSKEVLAATTKLRKAVFDVEAFAYSQQDFPGSDMFAGYCADGVVPRGDGGCKLKPVADKTKVATALKDAKTAYDDIVKASGGA